MQTSLKLLGTKCSAPQSTGVAVSLADDVALTLENQIK